VSPRPLIAAPMGIEALLVRSAARGARVRTTGMGPRRARAAAGRLLGEPGAALLVLGFCGGLSSGSAPGEVIVAEEVYAAPDEDDPPERVVCPHADELIGALARHRLQARGGRIVCVSRLALGERRAELRSGGASAVDMESVWLAPGAGGRPFAVVRVVLDSPSHELLRPQIAVQGPRAARALRRVAAALHDWAPEV
jgi:4-hydroxy-3-methylbut-2-en-1-yl diphosphate reductase